MDLAPMYDVADFARSRMWMPIYALQMTLGVATIAIAAFAVGLKNN